MLVLRKPVLVFVVLMLSIGFIPVQAEAPQQVETPTTTRVFYGGVLPLQDHATLMVNGQELEGKISIIYHVAVTTPTEPLAINTVFAEIWCYDTGCGQEIAAATTLQLEIWSEYRIQPIFSLDGIVTFRNMILGQGTRNFPQSIAVREITGFMPDFKVLGTSQDKIYRLNLGN